MSVFSRLFKSPWFKGKAPYVNCMCVSQVTDYAIARRIVDLHCRNMESVQRAYTPDEVQRYILFARQFQPKVS